MLGYLRHHHDSLYVPRSRRACWSVYTTITSVEQIVHWKRKRAIVGGLIGLRWHLWQPAVLRRSPVRGVCPIRNYYRLPELNWFTNSAGRDALTRNMSAEGPLSNSVGTVPHHPCNCTDRASQAL